MRNGLVGCQPGFTITLPGQHTAVIVGYGPVGQTVARLLRENQIVPTVVELNLETVRRLRETGFPAVYGDVRNRETLVSAGIQWAGSLVLSSAGMEGSAQVIRQARELNAGIHILARASYVRELPALRKAGADSVFSGEGEVALAVTETILRDLGATPEQIDRERDRVQAELFGVFAKTGKPTVPSADSIESSTRAADHAEAAPHAAASTESASTPFTETAPQVADRGCVSPVDVADRQSADDASEMDEPTS
jgi:Trk K+ transport system NAD-binding subunit